MPRRKTSSSDEPISKWKPATTPEERENQLISMAVDLAEKQIRDGTASAQVISHFLKLGSTRERLEQAKIRRENELLLMRTEHLASAANLEQVYADAIKAMQIYSGRATSDDDED